MKLLDELFPRKPKNLPRFDLMSGESIKAWIDKYTVAKLSKFTKRDLIDAGWFDSFGPDMYTITSAGVLIASKNTYGADTQTNAQLVNFVKLNGNPRFTPISTLENGTYGDNGSLHYNIVAITTPGGGAITNQIIAPGISGYKTCIKILGVKSSITEADTTLDFEDEDDTDLEGGGVNHLAFTADTMNTQLKDIIMRGTVASKSLEVDVAGHGAGGTILIYLVYWGEL